MFLEAAAESSIRIQLQKRLGSNLRERSCVFALAPTTVERRRAHLAKPERIARHAQSLRKIRYPTESEDLGNHPPLELKRSFRPYTPKFLIYFQTQSPASKTFKRSLTAISLQMA